MDAGLARRRSGPRFVGSHPLAGDHRTGPEHARADLFDGRTVVVTPTRATRPAAVTEVSGFWESLGANVTTMTPAEHDAALAMTSHLPHLVAVALAAATPTELLPLAASGWRDTTRIAGGDPKLVAGRFSRRIGSTCSMRSNSCSEVLDNLARNSGTRRRRKLDWRFWKRRRKRNGNAMLWEIDIHPADGRAGSSGERVAAAARELGLAENLQVATARGYLVQGEVAEPRCGRAAGERAAGRFGGRAGGRSAVESRARRVDFVRLEILAIAASRLIVRHRAA